MKNESPARRLDGLVGIRPAGKDKIMKWEWNGHKLPPLYRLVMRIIMIPVAHTARLILVFAIFIGWGELEASRLWRDTK